MSGQITCNLRGTIFAVEPGFRSERGLPEGERTLGSNLAHGASTAVPTPPPPPVAAAAPARAAAAAADDGGGEDEDEVVAAAAAAEAEAQAGDGASLGSVRGCFISGGTCQRVDGRTDKWTNEGIIGWASKNIVGWMTEGNTGCMQERIIARTKDFGVMNEGIFG